MAILSVITAIAIPSYNGYMHNSYLTECQNEVAAIALAQQEFFLENNEYFPLGGGTVSSDSTQITAIENASNGMYVSGYTSNIAGQTPKNLAKANCTFSVTSSTAAPGPSYVINVTARNNLNNPSDNFTFTK